MIMVLAIQDLKTIDHLTVIVIVIIILGLINEIEILMMIIVRTAAWIDLATLVDTVTHGNTESSKLSILIISFSF